MRHIKGQSINITGKPTRYREGINSIGYRSGVMDFKVNGIKYVILIFTEFLAGSRKLFNEKVALSVTGRVGSVNKDLIHVIARQVKKG